MTVVDPATIAKLSDSNKKLVLDHIRSKCTLDSSIEDLRNIAKFLAEEDSSSNNDLEIKILSGGLANFSYQIFTSDNSIKLYAKLTFGHMQLFPDIPCPISRTVNEYKMMEKFEDVAPGAVAKPLLCDDIISEDSKSKLLVAQWSKSDEQFGNQFIDGIVDIRVASKLGNAIASLHISDFDPEFNSAIRPLMHSFTPILMGVIDGLFTSSDEEGDDKAKPKDRVSLYAMEYTRSKLLEQFESYKNILDTRLDALTHGDFHVFNIMVESKPSVMTLENFGPNGDVVVCDFEMSAASFPGKDLGQFMGFPISCVFAHTLNDNMNSAQEILKFIDQVWDTYLETQKSKGGKTDDELSSIYREHMIFCGLYMLAYYGLNIHMNYLPFDENDVDNRQKTKESIGMIGLKCFILGNTTDPQMTLEELKAEHKSWLDEEMLLLTEAAEANKKKKARPSAGRRRSSMLRQMGRRVSDGHMHIANLDRESFTKMKESFRGLEEIADIACDN